MDIDNIYNGAQGTNDDRNSLLCRTNARGCCGPSDGLPAGDWFLPNGSIVNSDPAVGGYRKNRNTSVLRLYRDPVTTSASQRGRFRCEIPDANNVSQTLHANICK